MIKIQTLMHFVVIQIHISDW